MADNAYSGGVVAANPFTWFMDLSASPLLLHRSDPEYGIQRANAILKMWCQSRLPKKANLFSVSKSGSWYKAIIEVEGETPSLRIILNSD